MALFGFNPRDLERTLRRMGIKMETLRAERVEILLEDGSKLVAEAPQVLLIRAKGQPPMTYVIGELRRVEPEEAGGGGEAPFTEEDVRLVAEQAGVSLEEARRALEETGGDIAEAILRLRGESGS